MHIVADESIPQVIEAFSDLGDITLAEGRSISPALIDDADILLVRSVTPVSEKLIKEAKRLKFIASATSGSEHIDVPYLQKRGIGFAYAPGSNANSVAQYVVAALLEGAKKKGRSFSDMTLGIIGVGNIGSLVNKYAEALGIRCLLNDPPKQRESGSTIFRPLKEVLAESDSVTLHVPLEKQGSDPTYHLADPDFLKRMKNGSVLMNTSRGKVVDEDALKGMRAELGGLVIDVWDNEPAFDGELCGMADIATPHIAGYSYDGKIRGTIMNHDATCSFFHHSSSWNPEGLLSEPAGLIDVANAADPVFDAVQKAYPIMCDDAALREIAPLNAKDRGAGFDALRTQYPRRLEFSHYQVQCTKSQRKAAEILEKLGFNITIQEWRK
jgi:erythronate-4-phosphate dehydrogenase